jgi:signal transduction histidine kinase
VDKSRLEDAILKLSHNAYDAMNNEGKITIRAKNESLYENYCKEQPEATQGDFVMLSVSDTGCGMSPELLERAFEPFYTTKNLVEHKGLGLSMVYGFVKQSGGHIEIESEPEIGTVIKLFMPRTISS